LPADDEGLGEPVPGGDGTLDELEAVLAPEAAAKRKQGTEAEQGQQERGVTLLGGLIDSRSEVRPLKLFPRKMAHCWLCCDTGCSTAKFHSNCVSSGDFRFTWQAVSWACTLNNFIIVHNYMCIWYMVMRLRNWQGILAVKLVSVITI
jgi:hypothetical protein